MEDDDLLMDTASDAPADDYYDGTDDADDAFGVDADLDAEGAAAASSALMMHASTAPGARSLKRARSFESLAGAELASDVRALIEDVRDVTGAPKDVAVALLRQWKWNKEKLLEAFVDSPEGVLKKTGMPSTESEHAPADPNAAVCCAICMETVKATKTVALACNHRYCEGCWREFIVNKLNEGAAAAVSAHCPYPKCCVPVPDSTFRRLLPPEKRKIYDEFALRAYIDQNPRVKACPYPGCPSATRVDRVNRKEPVTCAECGFTYCFACNDFEIGDHRPAACAQVSKWMEKAADESENIKWLMANTKRCPMCRSPIEKNGGCMHMTCRKQAGGCGYEFCWLCRGPWSEHGSATGGYYSCNKYDKSQAKEEDVKAADAKSELDHYMFYYHRFDSHRRARKIAIEQRKNCSEKEDAVCAKFSVRSADTKFLYEAVDMLIQCRKVLEYSYVYGYFLDNKSKERQLFEYLQEDVEKYTNHLSSLFETALEKIADYHAFVRWKEEVTNYTRVTMKYLEHFSQGVANGLIGDDR
eukprot:m51a1_g6523 putative ariadne-like ubiquitin ligase (529) ;mRNA; r:301525-303567